MYAFPEIVQLDWNWGSPKTPLFAELEVGGHVRFAGVVGKNMSGLQVHVGDLPQVFEFSQNLIFCIVTGSEGTPTKMQVFFDHANRKMLNLVPCVFV